MEAAASHAKDSDLILPLFVLDSPISSGAKIMYALLCSYTRDKDFGWPAQTTLAERMSCSVSSVKKYLTELVKTNLISVRHRHNQSSYHYILQPAAQAEAGAVCPKPETAPVQPNTGYVEPKADRQQPITGYAQPESGYISKTKNQEKIQTPPLPPAPVSRSVPPASRPVRGGGAFFPDFEKLCEAYPRKEAMGLARRVWQQLLRNGQLPPLSELLAAIERFMRTASWQRENGRYIPQLHNFLRDERWLDPLSPEEEEAAQQRLAAEQAELSRKREQDAHEAEQQAERERLQPIYEAFKARFSAEDQNGSQEARLLGTWRYLHARYARPTAADVPDGNTLTILEFLNTYQRRREAEAYHATRAAVAVSERPDRASVNYAAVPRDNGFLARLLPSPRPLRAAV
jgi:DNA-binding MarR family transcriptional regulator